MNDAFADHWGAILLLTEEVTPEEEIDDDGTSTDDSFSNKPGYCFIVLDGENVAGGILCNAKLVERKDTGRVGSVFVRGAYRRKKIGSVLMQTSFNAFWNNGIKRIILDTDSESFSDTIKFYSGLGMKLYRREFLYEREIHPRGVTRYYFRVRKNISSPITHKTLSLRGRSCSSPEASPWHHNLHIITGGIAGS